MKAEAKLAAGIGIGFGLLHPIVWLLELPAWAAIAVKGAGVGFLALAALLAARDLDGWLLAAVLALGAAGDMVLQVQFGAGAATFALAHLVAILLYLRNRRSGSDGADYRVAAISVAIAVLIPVLLLQGRPEQLGFAIYGLLLGAMAGSAWLSRFPRMRVAVGAWLFLASDMLIAVGITIMARPAALSLAIWYLYFAGQLLIFLGVSGALAKPRSEAEA